MRMGKKKTVCFVKEKPSNRVYKEAYALRGTGSFKLILVCQECDKKRFEKVFDEIIYYNSILDKLIPYFNFRIGGININKSRIIDALERRFELRNRNLAKIIKKIKADLFQAHIPSNQAAATVIKNAQVPVIIDAYDFSGISVGLNKLNKYEKKYEKYCLENSKGICHKGSEEELNYYREKGYNIKSPDLIWLDYCDETFFALEKPKRISKKGDEIHLVYTGDLNADEKNPWKNYTSLGKILAKQKIHLHVYTHALNQDLSSYDILDKNEKYFHFYRKVMNYREMIKEVSKYDYGLWIHPVYGKYGAEGATEEKLKISMGNKLFTYLEAGLPILISNHLTHGKNIVLKNKAGISIKDEDLTNLREILSKLNYNKVKKNALRARKKLSLNKRSIDLVKFYEKVINSKK